MSKKYKALFEITFYADDFRTASKDNVKLLKELQRATRASPLLVQDVQAKRLSEVMK